LVERAMTSDVGHKKSIVWR